MRLAWDRAPDAVLTTGAPVLATAFTRLCRLSDTWSQAAMTGSHVPPTGPCDGHNRCTVFPRARRGNRCGTLAIARRPRVVGGCTHACSLHAVTVGKCPLII